MRSREPDVLAQHGEAPLLHHQGRRLEARLQGRDRRRIGHHPRGRDRPRQGEGARRLHAATAARKCRRAQEQRDEQRLGVQSVRLRPGDLRRLPGHLARSAAPSHAAHERHERHQRDLARRVAPRRRVGPSHQPDPRLRRGDAARRSTSSAASSSPTACCGCSRGRTLLPRRRASSSKARRRDPDHDACSSLCYLVAAVLFILCLRGLSSPEGARRGLFLGEVGMLIAVVGTLLHKDIITLRVDPRGPRRRQRASASRSAPRSR